MMESDYLKYRGKCKEYCDNAIKDDPTLRLVRGWYTCFVWRTREEHWWTVRQDGTIYDPTALQFPSKGLGEYEEFAGMLECAECGKEVSEYDAHPMGAYVCCSYECCGRLVGISI